MTPLSGGSANDNAMKELGSLSEEDGHSSLVACLRRKLLSGIGLLTFSFFLRPYRGRLLAKCDCLVVQTLVVQLVDLSRKSGCGETGEVLR